MFRTRCEKGQRRSHTYPIHSIKSYFIPSILVLWLCFQPKNLRSRPLHAQPGARHHFVLVAKAKKEHTVVYFVSSREESNPQAYYCCTILVPSVLVHSSFFFFFSAFRKTTCAQTLWLGLPTASYFFSFFTGPAEGCRAGFAGLV